MSVVKLSRAERQEWEKLKRRGAFCGKTEFGWRCIFSAVGHQYFATRPEAIRALIRKLAKER